MKRLLTVVTLLLCGAFLFSACFAEQDSTPAPAPKKAASKPAKTAAAAKKEPTAAPAAAKPAPAVKSAGDTLVIIARVAEIPGKFPANDLYNYVYILKYKVLSVVKGAYKGQEILVGHYNPLIPRSQIKDVMKKYVSGNVVKFEVGDKQMLTLITPIDKVWKDAIADEYSDSDLEKYYSLVTDIAK
jgi:hypothetical protein